MQLITQNKNDNHKSQYCKVSINNLQRLSSTLIKSADKNTYNVFEVYRTSICPKIGNVREIEKNTQPSCGNP